MIRKTTAAALVLSAIPAALALSLFAGTAQADDTPWGKNVVVAQDDTPWGKKAVSITGDDDDTPWPPKKTVTANDTPWDDDTPWG